MVKLIFEETLYTGGRIPTTYTMSTPTAAQIDALLNFLEEHRDLARGNLRSIEGRTLSHRLWGEICDTLNAMGGCSKTTKQWQKVWTDKKYLAKKAAAAARRSASATGGGPATAPSLTQWEIKVISIMGDGFGEPQTTARVPAFIENTTETTTAALTQSYQEDLPQPNDSLRIESLPSEPDTQVQQTSQQDADLFAVLGPSTSASDASGTRRQITPTRPRREFRRHSASPQADSSVRDRLFRLEEHRVECEERRNDELSGIRIAVVELCRHMQQLTEQLQSRRH